MNNISSTTASSKRKEGSAPTVAKKLTFTILSISLLTVMAGAAIAPALGVIKDYFSSCSDMLIQLIVSIPALFIILTNLLFPFVSKKMGSKTIAIVGLVMYVAFGAGAFFCKDIWTLLVLRALLGVSVGLIMPLSTGLLSFYFPPEKQPSLMGLSAAMNQLGGVVATLLAGLLANIHWNLAFLVYLLGLVALVAVLLILPNERLGREGGDGGKLSASPLAILRRFHPSVTGMFILMLTFFVYPTNFALVARNLTEMGGNAITVVMVLLDVVAFLVGLVFGKMMERCPHQMKYVAPVLFLGGYLLMSWEAVASWGLIAGSMLVGLANGVGVPYLNTIASMKAGKSAATTVMPFLSAALYLGQFVSPLIVLPLGSVLFPESGCAPFRVGVILSAIFLVQMFLTRRFQVVTATKED